MYVLLFVYFILLWHIFSRNVECSKNCMYTFTNKKWYSVISMQMHIPSIPNTVEKVEHVLWNGLDSRKGKVTLRTCDPLLLC